MDSPTLLNARLSQMRHYRKVGSFFYLLLLAPLSIAFLYIPSVAVSSEFYRDIYYTKTFQFSKLVFFFFALVTGYIYVTSVTLRLKRESLIAGRNHKYRDFSACVALGLSLFFLGPNATLLGFDDNSNIGYLIIYDYCTWCLAFWLGINWTHLDDIKLLRQFNLNPRDMCTWSWHLWTLFAFCLVLLSAVAAYECYLLYTRHLMFYILIGYASCFITLILICLLRRSSHHFHLHHYQLFALLVPLTMTQNWVSAIVQGFSVGVFVEGLARWGFDNCFIENS